ITKWPQVLGQAYRCMKPGAYIELAEGETYMRSDDGSLTEGNPLRKFGNRLNEAMLSTGRVPQSEELLRGRLEKAGFVDVKSFTLKQPFGPWAKNKYEHILDHSTTLNLHGLTAVSE
ncbi:hypothetical protein FN846DRAFT_783253, partial [Sphaerosporella brunnea]